MELGILISLGLALLLKMFNEEIEDIAKKIRSKLFESVVIVGLIVIIAMLTIK